MATLAGSAGSRKKLPIIDMTPMVDLAFLLLTFFVLTTTLTQKSSLHLRMPEKAIDGPHASVDGKKVLTLVLGPHNKIYWYMGVANGVAETTDFSNSGIRKILIDKMAAIRNLHVLIKPSDQSKYENMVDLLDEILITSVERYAIVEMEEPDRKLIAAN
jgi:biopolymer transport protein ExbD